MKRKGGELCSERCHKQASPPPGAYRSSAAAVHLNGALGSSRHGAEARPLAASCDDFKLQWPGLGVAAKCNARPYMEDTYFVGEISGLPAQGSFGHGHQMPANLAVCSVFDGHGGASVSEYCSKHFQERATGCIGQLLGGSAVDFHEAVLTGLRRAFLALDQELGKEAQLCGTTATACIVSEEQIYIASCGKAYTTGMAMGPGTMRRCLIPP